MKKFLMAICLIALLSGCSEEHYHTTVVHHVYHTPVVHHVVVHHIAVHHVVTHHVVVHRISTRTKTVSLKKR